MKILESYTKMMKQFINEADEEDGEGRIDMKDPVMQKTGWAKDKPDLTIGGALKQGKNYEYYDDAKAIVDKEKGKDSGKDDAGKVTDFSRDGGDEPNPIGDKGDVPVGQLPDPSTRQGDPEANKAYQAKKAAKAKAAEKPKDEPKAEPKSKRPKSIHLDFDEADDGVDSLRYAGSLDDNPGLEKNLDDMYDLIDSGQATDDEIERAKEIADTLSDARHTNEFHGDDLYDVGKDLESAIDRHVKGKASDNKASDDEKSDDRKIVGYRFAGKTYKNKDDAPVADPTPVYESESIKVINGKKYKAVKETKESNKHILKENYDRFFGDKKWFHY